MFAVFGGGFGLYGYVPTLIQEFGQTVVLEQAYYDRFLSRSELQPFFSYIKWVSNQKASLDVCDGAVLALRPADQVKWVYEIITRPNIKNILLEKPLAPNPELAIRVLDSLIKANKRFRIGYTFRYTNWGERFLKVLSTQDYSKGGISITWKFHAHHFKHNLNNWKRYHFLGGGVLRFYGIHLLAFLAEAGYKDVKNSVLSGKQDGEPDKWTATFIGNGLPNCTVEVDSQNYERVFSIKSMACEKTKVSDTDSLFCDLNDPFESEIVLPGGLDERIGPLTYLCKSLEHENESEYKFYELTNDLWRKVEMATTGLSADKEVVLY